MRRHWNHGVDHGSSMTALGFVEHNVVSSRPAHRAVVTESKHVARARNFRPLAAWGSTCNWTPSCALAVHCAGVLDRYRWVRRGQWVRNVAHRQTLAATVCRTGLCGSAFTRDASVSSTKKIKPRMYWLSRESSLSVMGMRNSFPPLLLAVPQFHLHSVQLLTCASHGRQ